MWRLCHLVAELFATENVEVQVLYGLTAVLTYVADDSVSVREAELFGDLGDYGEDMSYGVGVFLGDLVCRCDVFLGNYKAVHGRLGSNIEECIAFLVLINLA